MAASLKTVFTWHRWLGLAAGLLLVLIGFSGALAVFKAELDWLVTPALRAAHPPAGAPRPSPDAFIASLQHAYPGARLNSLELAPAAGFAPRAVLRPAGEERAREVFLDPRDATVRGERVVGEGYFWSLHNLVRQFHVRLLMGTWGRVFVGVFGVVLAFSCLTGLWIYRGGFRHLFRLRWRGHARTRWSDLHRLVGLWSLLFNLLIALTGAVLGLENLAARVQRDWLGRPPADESPPRATAVGAPLSASALVACAQAAFPELRPRLLVLPSQPGRSVLIRGDAGLLIARNTSYVALDPVSGDVLAIADRRHASGWERLYLTFNPLHFGYFGGYGVKVLWFPLGLAPGALALTGFWLWWRRTRAARPAPAALASIFVTRTALAATGLTLAAAYALAARAQGDWSLTNRLLEHALAKPLALAFVAFPVTALLGWLALRAAAWPGCFAFVCALCGAWYLGLVSLFQ